MVSKSTHTHARPRTNKDAPPAAEYTCGVHADTDFSMTNGGEPCAEGINHTQGTCLPTDAKARKQLPIATGVLDYFPKALAAIAEVSRIGNDQHNPGQPLHWDKTKSTDHADCLIRHMLERGTIDKDGARHSAKAAWRALALCEMEIELAEQQAHLPER